MMTTEQIEQEIATLTQQRDNFIQQVNLQVAEQIGHFNGQIATWQKMLEPPVETGPVEGALNGYDAAIEDVLAAQR